MEHQALYRKFRPSSFADVIGQEAIVKTLTNKIKTGSIRHAYLFSGSRGIGKTTCAKIFARAINCLSPENGSPCGKCKVCQELAAQNNMDILEIDAASNNKVDEIRELKEKVKYPPISGKYKVYIIDEVHMLTESAFNALLKTLEEPPSYVVFILATTEAYKLPATILSRCLKFDFKLIDEEILIEQLKKIFAESNITYDEDSLKLIAKAAEGSDRDCLTIADCVASFSENNITIDKTLKVLGIRSNEENKTILTEIINGNIGNILTYTNQLYKNGTNLIVFIKNLLEYLRNLLVCKSCNKPEEILALPKNNIDEMIDFSKTIATEQIIYYMSELSKIETELKTSLSVKLLVETTLLKIASVTLDDVKKN